MIQNKALSLLSLAARGRNLVSGEFAVEEAVKSGKACVVVVAGDASGNTKKLFFNKCSFYEIPVYSFGTKEQLGHAIGKDIRSSLAVTDEGLAQAVIKQLETQEE